MMNESKRGWDIDRFKTIVAEAKLSMRQVANGTGIGLPVLNAYCRGKCEPSLEKLLILSDYLCLPVDVLVGNTSQEEYKNIMNCYSENFMKVRRKDYEATFLSRPHLISKTDKINQAPWPYNLLDEVVRPMLGDNNANESWQTPIEKKQEEGLYYVLSTLTDREKEILLTLYEKGKTLEEVGREFNVTRERIRQIAKKAIRKMRRPHNRNLILYGLDYPQKFGVLQKREEELRTEEVRLDMLEEDIAIRRAFLENYLEEGSSEDNTERSLKIDKSKLRRRFELANCPSKSIESLDLSTRSYNCLRRGDIETIGDLIQKAEEGDLHKLKNLGRKSLNEILSVLKEIGHDFYGVYDV